LSNYREVQMRAAASASREWTLNKIKKGIEPTMDDFIAEFPCFDVKALRDIAGKEMFQIKNMETLEALSNEGIG